MIAADLTVWKDRIFKFEYLCSNLNNEFDARCRTLWLTLSCENPCRNATACRLAVLLNPGGSSKGLVTLSEGITLTQERGGSDRGLLTGVSLLLLCPLQHLPNLGLLPVNVVLGRNCTHLRKLFSL
jgi:hypothetical protein